MHNTLFILFVCFICHIYIFTYSARLTLNTVALMRFVELFFSLFLSLSRIISHVCAHRRVETVNSSYLIAIRLVLKIINMPLRIECDVYSFERQLYFIPTDRSESLMRKIVFARIRTLWRLENIIFSERLFTLSANGLSYKHVYSTTHWN